MAIPVFDKFKSVTAEGKLLDYDEIADVPIERRDLATNPPTEDGYYQQTVSSGNFDKGVIYRRYSDDYIIPIDPLSYVDLQNLEDGRYDLSAYGFVLANSNQTTDIVSSDSININATNDIYLSASTGNEEIYINLQKSNKDIAIAGDTIHLSGNVYENGKKLSNTYAPLTKFKDLEEARFNLSNYFKELDTFYGDNSDVSAWTDGIHWSNNVAFIGDHGEYQGKYWGNAPIVAGDNVTFTVDSTNQVVKISANLSNHATKTYVDNAVSALVDSSPETLNTLNELAAALGDDPNFATTVSTQIGKKQNTITGAATTITSSNLTASRALVSDANGKVAVSAVTSTELGYLDGVTSNIQTQLNGKLSTTGKAASATVADSANAVAWSKVSGKPTFATVATSGSYNDLSNKPTIPTTLPASDVYAWAKAKTKPSYSYSEITGKPTLATVATSGSYNDLSNKPTIPAAVSVTQKLTSGTEIGSVTVGSKTTKLYAPTATSVDLSGYLPLSGGTIKGNILFSNSNAQGSQPNLKWKTINSKTPYVGYCTASADGTFLVASIGGTSYTTGLSIGGSSGNLLWKGTRVATTADIPSLSNYSTLANTIKALSISGKTITYTKGDGTTGTLTTQDTVYSLPTAGKNTLGGVKTTSTVTSASGYTACPIIGGVPYYKDTGATIASSLEIGAIRIDGVNYILECIDNHYNNIYLGYDTVEINGLGIGLYGDTTIAGKGVVNLVVGENDEAYISLDAVGIGRGVVDISAKEIYLNGNVTVNGEPIGSGGGGSSGGWRQVTFDEFKTSCTNGTIVRLVPNLDNDTSYSSRSYGFRNLGLQIVCADNGSFRVRNTEIDTYNDTQTALVFFTYELSRMDEDIIYLDLYQSLVDISNGVLASDLMDEQELDDSNCEFYIWEG